VIGIEIARRNYLLCLPNRIKIEARRLPESR
jgi:hypothetical protein